MLATPHVLVGAAAARHARTAARACLIGVATHVALDVLPHWGVEGDWQRGGARRRAFLAVAVPDGLLALAALTWVARTTGWSATLGAVAAIVPDLDKPAALVGVQLWPDVVNRVHGGIQRHERRRRWPVDVVTAAAAACLVKGCR